VREACPPHRPSPHDDVPVSHRPRSGVVGGPGARRAIDGRTRDCSLEVHKCSPVLLSRFLTRASTPLFRLGRRSGMWIVPEHAVTWTRIRRYNALARGLAREFRIDRDLPSSMKKLPIPGINLASNSLEILSRNVAIETGSNANSKSSVSLPYHLHQYNTYGERDLFDPPVRHRHCSRLTVNPDSQVGPCKRKPPSLAMKKN
jgi:hypothetical protein